ncbi:MAG: transposase [Myxococcaceae bacterium]
MYSQDGVYFVSVRTTQARPLFRPSAEVNELVGGVFARAVERYGIEVFGFVFLSNHLHLLVRVRDGLLSRFMQYLLSNIARKIGKLVDWPGRFWDGPFHVTEVLDDGAMIARLRYILDHGVKEGLVAKVTDWPGLSCASQLLGERSRSFRWFSWAKRWLSGKLRRDLAGLLDDDLAEEVTLTLSVLPIWRELSPDRQREEVQKLIDDIERTGALTHPKPLGVAGVLAQDPHARPIAPKKSRRPICHASDPELRKDFISRYREFVAAFRRASERFRRGDWQVPFPALAFRPPAYLCQPEQVAAAA